MLPHPVNSQLSTLSNQAIKNYKGMYSNEHTLQDLLKKAYRRLDMDDTVMEMEVRRAYEKTVGDLIGRLSRIVGFAGGTLTVEVASAALRQELWQRRESLAGRINEAVGRPAVKKIVFV